MIEASPIVDLFGRIHNYLRISLTERCNLRCTYCMPAEGIVLRDKSNFMNTQEVLGIATTFVQMGIKKIRLTGGEPLVRKDAATVIEELGKLPIELAITTNGILADQFINSFKTAGLHTINVSLDSLEKEKFNSISRRNYFDKVVSNIDLLIASGFTIKVNVVLMRGINDNEICDFIEWAAKKNIQVRFIEFMPFSGNRWDWSKGVSYNEIMEKVNARFGNSVLKMPDKKNDTAKNYRLADQGGSFAIISSVTNPFCSTCNRIRLTADGKIKNCLFSGTETDLLNAYRRGENIEQIIRSSILDKKAIRAGMESFEDFSNTDRNSKNRSMIAIGG